MTFKTNCLAVMDEVHAKHESKHGKPVAKLVPVNTDKDEIYNFLVGTGDVVSPTISTYQNLARYEFAAIHDSPTGFKVIQFAIRSASNATLSA